MSSREGCLDAHGDAPAGRHGVPVLPSPVPHRLDLIPPGHRRLDSAPRLPGPLRCEAGAVFHVLREFFAQPGGIAGAEVDLEVRAVKADLDVFDVLGGAVEVVDEERSGDGEVLEWSTPSCASITCRAEFSADSRRRAWVVDHVWWSDGPGAAMNSSAVRSIDPAGADWRCLRHRG